MKYNAGNRHGGNASHGFQTRNKLCRNFNSNEIRDTVNMKNN